MKLPTGLFYILKDGQPIASDDIEALKEFLEDLEDDVSRIIRRTEIKDILISTVFLGVNHNLKGPPILFETMIFNHHSYPYQTRCSTIEDAYKMHGQAIKWLCKEEPDTMGEVADMMLDGTLCECCGQLLIGPGKEPAGYPQYCSKECAEANGAEWTGLGDN